MEGAALMYKKAALKRLHSELEREKKESVSAMCSRIQSEKHDAMRALRREHNEKKRRKFEQIRAKYMDDEAMQGELKLLDLGHEMDEEIDLLSRFEMFADRIKQLQRQIQSMKQTQEITEADTAE